MGAYSQIPVLFVMRGLIIIFTQLRPGSLFITRGLIINYTQLRPASFHYAGLNHHFYSITPRWFTIHVA